MLPGRGMTETLLPVVAELHLNRGTDPLPILRLELQHAFAILVSTLHYLYYLSELSTINSDNPPQLVCATPTDSLRQEH